MSALCYGRGGLALTEDRKREFLATTAKAFVESANAFMEAHGGGWIAGADITVADFVYWHVRLNGGPRSPARVGRGGETDRDPRSRPPGAREAQPVRGGRARRRAEAAGDDRGSRGAAGRQDVHGERRLHPLAHLRCVSSRALQRTEPLEPQVSFLTSRRQPSVPGASAHWGGGGGDPKTER